MAQNELHLKVTLRIYSDDDQRCFGPGIATLLQRVREHHSLRAGAASMEMAYSKAWRIIRTAETAVSYTHLAPAGRSGSRRRSPWERGETSPAARRTAAPASCLSLIHICGPGTGRAGL